MYLVGVKMIKNQLGYDSNQPGNGSNTNQNIPKLISSLENKSIIKLITGGHHTFALSKNGDIYGFGRNEYGQLGNKSFENISIPQKINFNLNIKRIKAGCNHSMILTSNNKVYSTGCNDGGQLGLGDKKIRNEFKEIEFLSNKEIDRIYCFYEHSFAISNSKFKN